jgi:predicted RNA-binding protein with PIN domain
MKLLVDGYNLLHASGVFGQPADAPTLENSRQALLGYLAENLSERDRSRATVVFDGKDAPKGLPEISTYQQINILFSRRKQSADDLIADLIAAEKQPRELLVISSDHGVQRSARQRGVAFQDSEGWIRTLRSLPLEPPPAEKPELNESTAEQQQWLREFTSQRDQP